MFEWNRFDYSFDYGFSFDYDYDYDYDYGFDYGFDCDYAYGSRKGPHKQSLIVKYKSFAKSNTNRIVYKKIKLIRYYLYLFFLQNSPFTQFCKINILIHTIHAR